jgi:mevalonate kinase
MKNFPVGFGRAAGKVILFGEHAVVYGVPAIAAGLSRGAAARATFSDNDTLTLGGVQLSSDHELLDALRSMREVLGMGSVNLELKLEFPAGAGLGASAAMAVASARALSELQETTAEKSAPLSDRRIFEAAQSWETVFHGTPSGVDVAAAQYCRPIRFQKGSDAVPIILSRPLHLAVAEAGPPASTKEMVASVAGFKARNPVQFDRTLQAISALVDNASLLLASGDQRAVGKLMDLNQILLSGWMLSTGDIELACRLARDAGAFGAKLTGSGGGGCVIALAEDEASTAKILDAWRGAELNCFSARVGGESATNHEECHK